MLRLFKLHALAGENAVTVAGGAVVAGAGVVNAEGFTAWFGPA
jgi:hypothetical protein